MSGVKETTRLVTEREYRRLRDQAARATSLAAANAALNKMDTANRAEMRRYQQRLDRMNGSMSDLSAQLRRERDNATKRENDFRRQLADTVAQADRRVQAEAAARKQDMERMDERFHAEMSAAQDQLQGEIRSNSARLQAAINASDQALRAQMAETAGQLQSRIDSVHNEVSTLQGKMDAIDSGNAALLEQARGYYEAAGEVLADTLAHYRAELLVGADRLTEVRGALGKADTQLQTAAGNPMNASVARLTASEAFEEAVRYRQEVLQAEQEWNQRYQAAAQAVNAAQAQLEASRSVELRGKPFDVDHWTDGELSEIGRRLQGLSRNLANAENASLEELEGYRENAVRRAEEIDAAATFAVAAVEASQNRFTLTQQMAQELFNRFGLVFVKSDGRYAGSYEGGDQRAAYRLHMKNPKTGLEIVVTQTPVAQEGGAIATRITSDILHYGDRSVQEADDTVRSILGTLGLSDGQNAGAVETRPGYETKPSDLCVDQVSWGARTETKPASVAAPVRQRSENGTCGRA